MSLVEPTVLIKNSKKLNGQRSGKQVLTRRALNVINDWQPKRKSSNRKETYFDVIDFFCGCGGMSLGFDVLSRLGPFCRLLGGCDIDEEALATYESNFGVPGINADVRELASNEDSLSRFLNKLDRYNPNAPLIVIGCAPCQGFSSHRKKKWDEQDIRNSLIIEFSSLATRLNPECIIMENVPELLSEKYWPYFETARSILNNSGYVVKQAIYNAATFGVPQERFRAVVIAMKQDFLLPNPFLTPEEYVTVRQAIGQLPPVSPGETYLDDKLHRSADHRLSTIETIRSVKKDGGSRPPGIGPKCLDRVNGYYDVYGRLSWDLPSITITHYARNPASGRFVHPEQDRGLTAREAAILQSFPVGFNFTGSFDSIFKQIGEAVPPKLACGIAANVITELLSTPPTKEESNQGIVSVEKISSSFSSVIASRKVRRKSE